MYRLRREFCFSDCLTKLVCSNSVKAKIFFTPSLTQTETLMSTHEVIVSAGQFDVLAHFKTGELPCKRLRIVEVGKSFQCRFENSIEPPREQTTVRLSQLPFNGDYFAPISTAINGIKDPWIETGTIWQILLDYDSGRTEYLVTEETMWKNISIFFSRSDSADGIIYSTVYILMDRAGNVSVFGAPADIRGGRMNLTCCGVIFLPHT